MVDKVEDACANNKRRCSSDAPSSHMGILNQSETWTKRGTTMGFHGCYISLGPPFNGNGWEDVFGWVWRIFTNEKFGLSMEKRCPRILFLSLAGQKALWRQDETIWSLLSDANLKICSEPTYYWNPQWRGVGRTWEDPSLLISLLCWYSGTI